MTAGPDLAGLLADRSDTVVLTQAATPTEARLTRERIVQIRNAYVKLLADWPSEGARGGRPPRSEQSPAPGTAL